MNESDPVAAGTDRLRERLGDRGSLADPKLSDVLTRVPRHRFLPGRVWVDGPGGWYVPLYRDRDPDAWWRLAYADEPVVTQVDDGREPAERGGAEATSSASMPSLVFAMLAYLDLSDGHRVLEIGTGTGFNAGLLCARLGASNVTTVEIDPEMGESARTALAGVGFNPEVVLGDGANGYAPKAPYDRVVATCAVHQVPYAWVEQCRPGGVILTPWGTPYHNDGLLKLRVGGDGSASGRFVGGSAFMFLREQRTPLVRISQVIRDDHEPAVSTTGLDVREVLSGPGIGLVVALHVPKAWFVVYRNSERPERFTYWIVATDHASWASVVYEPGETEWAVEQYGLRRLWDEVETAYEWWQHTGRPERERFGLTVTSDSQRVWLDHRDSADWWETPR